MLNKDDSSIVNVRSVALTIAHEMAHLVRSPPLTPMFLTFLTPGFESTTRKGPRCAMWQAIITFVGLCCGRCTTFSLPHPRRVSCNDDAGCGTCRKLTRFVA